jgi:hypothetical protein
MRASSVSFASCRAGCGGEDVGETILTDFFVFVGGGGVVWPTYYYSVFFAISTSRKYHVPEPSPRAVPSVLLLSAAIKLTDGAGGAVEDVIWDGEARKGFPDMMKY